jgi:hypothetical protein
MSEQTFKLPNATQYEVRFQIRIRFPELLTNHGTKIHDLASQETVLVSRRTLSSMKRSAFHWCRVCRNYGATQNVSS